MVFQVEDYLVHSDPPLQDDPARLIQDKACDQTQYQMAIIGIFTMDLAGVSRQERLEGADHLFNQVPTRPDPQQTRGANLCGHAEQVDAILTELVYQDQGDFAIGSTLSPQAGIATAWCLQTLTPGPMVTLDSIAAFDFTPLGEDNGLGRCALDK
jgi:hypothetical protein